MGKIFKNTIALLMASVFMIVAGVTAVSAAENVFSVDAAGNWFGAGQTVDTYFYTDGKVDNELFVAGMDVSANDVDVDGSVFAAGNNVNVCNTEIGGSLFVAGSNVTVDAKVNNNIFAAGSSLTFKEDTEVRGLNAAGATVYVKGEYEAANVSAGTVVFNAKADGDVIIEADDVTIGENAEIGGTLKVKSKNEPTLTDSAKIADYEYEQIVEDTEEKSAGLSLIGSKDALKGAGKAAMGFAFLKKVKRAIKNLFRYALLAVIFVFVFKKNLTESYEYATKQKAGALWGFGALTLIFFPVAAIILCITIIGLPLAGLLTGIYVLALCFAYVFTFASLVRELIFTHTSKRLDPMLETVLAVLPAAIIKEIPFIGGLVGFACAIYTLGYIVLFIAKTIDSNRTPKVAKEAVAEEVVAENTEE